MKEKSEQIYEAGFQGGLTAAYIGLLAGLFGLWGLAHVLNGKAGMGCLWMLIVGALLGGILGSVVVATGGLAGIIVPLWLYIVYSQAKNGASHG